MTVVLVIAGNGQVQAQEDPPTVDNTVRVSPQPGDVMFSLRGGFEHKFDTDIDDGGEFNVTIVEGGVSAQSILSDTLSLGLNFDYAFDQYDFSGSSGIGGLDPWEDIHTMRVGVLLNYRMSDDWVIYGGPLLVAARESGASFSDSDSYGGVIGLQYRQSETLTWGLGVGFIDRLEDGDTQVFPAIVVNWQIKDGMRLASNSNSRRSGVELVFDLNKTTEVAVGLGYEWSRFRLDDKDIAPDGIGEVTSVPIWVRYSLKPSSDLTINLTGGISAGGTIEIEDSSGNSLRDEDFDPAAFVGVSVTFNF